MEVWDFRIPIRRKNKNDTSSMQFGTSGERTNGRTEETITTHLQSPLTTALRVVGGGELRGWAWGMVQGVRDEVIRCCACVFEGKPRLCVQQ